MVEATLSATPADWLLAVLIDWSGGVLGAHGAGLSAVSGALMLGSASHAAAKREPNHLAHRFIERLVARRRSLWREDLAAQLRPDRNPAHDRCAKQRMHRPGLKAIDGQLAVFRVPLRQVLPCEVAADAPGEGSVCRPSSVLVGAFTQRKRSAPSGCSVYTPSRKSIWKSRSRFSALPKLDQRDRAGLGRLARQTGPF